jgi:hypothetical protein
LEEPLQLLATLAHEYQQKYNQLASALRDADPDLMPRQLKMRAELATDRFRSAQMDLLSKLSIGAVDTQLAGYEALIALFRSFDEMRIVFQLLLEHLSTDSAARQ